MKVGFRRTVSTAAGTLLLLTAAAGPAPTTAPTTLPATPPAVHRWQPDAVPGRILSGVTVYFQVVDGKFKRGATVGYGSGDTQSLDRPAALVWRTSQTDGRIRVDSPPDGSVSVEVPPGSTFRERAGVAIGRLTDDYQPLWVTDVIRGGRVVNTLAYVIRSVPVDPPQPAGPDARTRPVAGGDARQLPQSKAVMDGFARPTWKGVRATVEAGLGH